MRAEKGVARSGESISPAESGDAEFCLVAKFLINQAELRSVVLAVSMCRDGSEGVEILRNAQPSNRYG